jgi:hypothetical protein
LGWETDEEGRMKIRLRMRLRLRKKHKLLLSFIGVPFFPLNPAYRLAGFPSPHRGEGWGEGSFFQALLNWLLLEYSRVKI